MVWLGLDKVIYIYYLISCNLNTTPVGFKPCSPGESIVCDLFNHPDHFLMLTSF